MARKLYLEQQLKNKVTDDVVKKVYADYTDKYKGQKEVKARHILVDDEKVANEAIEQLKGCEAHSTVILSQVDSDVYRKIGMNLTCEPRYQTKKLYHK